MKKIIFIIFFLYSVILWSNEIIGTIKNYKDSTAVIYANVQLFSSDSMFLKSELTDISGNFKFKNLKKGNYFLKITALGFKDTSLFLELSKSKKILTVYLKPKDIAIENIIVRPKNFYLKQDAEGITIFPGKEEIAKSADLIDLLSLMPNLSVNRVTKQISLGGSNNVLVLINGNYLLNNVYEYLSDISPDQLVGIKINYFPSVKYEKDYDAVINIIVDLTKHKGYILNNEFSSAFYRPLSYAENILSFQRVNKKTRVYVKNSMFYNTNSLEFDRNLILSDKDTISINNLWSNENFLFAKILYGLEIYPNPKTSLIFLAKNIFNLDSISDNYAYYVNNIYQYDISNTKKNKANFNSFSCNFNKNLKNESLFQLQTNIDNFYKKSYIYYNSGQNTLLTTDKNNFKLYSDYKFKLFDININLGEKFYFRKISFSENDHSFFYNELRTNLYIEADKNFKFCSVKTGIRYSNTNITENDTIKNIFSYLFPEFILFKKVSKKFTLKLGLKSFILYPNINYLNPYSVKIDENTYSSGNPYLKPAYKTKNFLQLNFYHKNIFLKNNFGFIHVKDVIAPYTIINNDLFINSFDNNKFYNKFYWSQYFSLNNILKIFNLSVNNEFYLEKFSSSQSLNKSYSLYFEIMSRFKHNFFIYFKSSFYGKKLIINGIERPSDNISFAVGKFFKKINGFAFIYWINPPVFNYENIRITEYNNEVFYEKYNNYENNLIGFRLKFLLKKGKIKEKRFKSIDDNDLKNKIKA